MERGDAKSWEHRPRCYMEVLLLAPSLQSLNLVLNVWFFSFWKMMRSHFFNVRNVIGSFE